MEKTLDQYQSVISECRALFENKLHDYGPAWRILRMSSLTDQIYIKANRIRSLQEKSERKVDEGEESEFIGIINYSVIALIQLEHGTATQPDFSVEKSLQEFDKQVQSAQKLMQDKNHDYGEAWRDMSQESFADLIIMKLLRIRQILSNEGKTIVSEGIDANYVDIINYSLFALILIDEGIHQA